MESQFKLFSEPKEIYESMLSDINSSKESILLETYIFRKDAVGKRFIEALTLKAKEGVKVKLLLDSWGTSLKKSHFSKLIKNGGELKKVREIRYVFNWFSKNHERDHKKLLIIDDKITYVGSCNITSECLNWRELVLRLEGEISQRFKKFFYFTLENAKIVNNLKEIFQGDFQILYDFPSSKFRLGEQKYKELIDSAKKEICIETPYFVPSFIIRKAVYKAIRRGVKVRILLPYIGDVKIMDIVRNRYVDNLYRKKAKIYFYTPKILHSKLLIIDNKFFILGSSNLDYRSFMHQYEINVLGRDKKIIRSLKKFFENGIENSVKFNYTLFKSRFSFVKFLEKVLKKFEKYL